MAIKFGIVDARIAAGGAAGANRFAGSESCKSEKID